MHLYISLSFYAFQSVFFAAIYDVWILHSSYFIFGFGAGNKMIDPHVHILALPSNFLICSSSNQLSVILSQYPVFYYGNTF